MKKFFIIFPFAVTLLAGCDRAAEINVEQAVVTQQEDQYTVDMVYSVFSSTDRKTGESCAALNTEIGLFLGALADDLRTDAAETLESLEGFGIDRPAWKYELTVTDTVFVATDRYVSVRFEVYNFSGGAHGMTNYRSFNYDVKERVMLEDYQIVDQTRSDEIDSLLQARFDDREGCFSESPSVHNVSAINITPDGVVFSYDRYVLGAYYCGPYQVVIPDGELGEILLAR